MKIKEDTDLWIITTFWVILFLVVLPINALGQQEKIELSVVCLCLDDKYLVKVFDPEDGYKLLGEKWTTGSELIAGEKIYLDKKFMGKQLQFELIDSSGDSIPKFEYIMEEGQYVGFDP